MNKKQYNNVIENTLKHEQSEDSLSTARAIFDNMGVALPQGDMKTVYETISTDNYMGWKSCTMQEAQAAADKGVAAIGISGDKIVVLSANDEEQPVAQTASVMSLDENTSAYAVAGLEYYSYSYGVTGQGGCGGTGSTTVQVSALPPLFQSLTRDGYFLVSQIESTIDGFFMCRKPLSYILNNAGIYALLDDIPCNMYYDDWYLYSIYDGATDVYSLVKMREQEADNSDNNDPGVTISFISLNTNILSNCLCNGSNSNKEALYNEIQRIVQQKGQTHNTVLQQYFNNPASVASYNIAELYIQHIADSANGSQINLPNKYLDILEDIASYERLIEQLEGRTDSGSQMSVMQARAQIEELSRIPNFIESINQSVGYTVCDGEKIVIQSPCCLSSSEKYAILATHTGNVSLNSFAAEVKYHAYALETWYGAWNLLGAYEKAIRADMAIGEEYQSGITDQYYDLDSDIVQEQVQYHGEK